MKATKGMKDIIRCIKEYGPFPGAIHTHLEGVTNVLKYGNDLWVMYNGYLEHLKVGRYGKREKIL